MSDAAAGPTAPAAVPEDGPWRLAQEVRLVVVADWRDAAAPERAARAAARLQAGGLPISDARVAWRTTQGALPADPGDWNALLPGGGTADFDVLVLDACVDFDGVSAHELRRVAGTDPMIAFAVPCFLAGEADAARPMSEIMTERRAFFPPVGYVVLPDRRCFYLKGAVWAEFGSASGALEPDWDAAALTINRFGFRVVEARHALARWRAEAKRDPQQSLTARAARLERAHPGARAALASARGGAPRAAELLFEAALPDADGRRAVVFDLAHVTPRHSGTTELARALMGRAALDWPDVALHVLATPAVYDLHVRDLPNPPVRIDPDDPKRFAAFIRIGQPFNWKDLDRAVHRATALVFFMLDTIAFDCLQLAPDELDAVLRFTLAEADGVLFNSAFTSRQFERRFRLRPDLPRLVSLHSLDVEDYRGGAAGAQTGAPDSPARAVPRTTRGAARRNVLIVGNALPHKNVEATARLLAEPRLGLDLFALGLTPGSLPGVTAYPSGSLDAGALAALFGHADVVIYPSVYEGFGFPVPQALAWGKPVLARRLPPLLELTAALPEATNLHFFDSEADLLRLITSSLAWREERLQVEARTWDDATADLRHILDQAIAGAGFDRTLRRIEFMRGRMAWSRAKSFRPQAEADGQADLLSEDFEKIAGFAGRLAQGLVLRLGRTRAARWTLFRVKTLRQRGNA